jgi:hypothetical protein
MGMDLLWDCAVRGFQAQGVRIPKPVLLDKLQSTIHISGNRFRQPAQKAGEICVEISEGRKFGDSRQGTTGFMVRRVGN